MRLTLEFMDAGRGVRLSTDGNVPGRLMVRAHRSFAREHLERFARCRYWYSDHSRVSGLHWTAADASEIAFISEALARVNPGLVIANWVPADLAFGMARMWEALASEVGWRVLTGRTAEPLHDWLSEQVGATVDPLAAPELVVFDSERADT